MDKVLKESTNKKVLKLQLKSNRLKKSKSLSGFLSLEVLNLTANAFEMINIDYLSTKIKSLNLSKCFIVGNFIFSLKYSSKRKKSPKLSSMTIMLYFFSSTIILLFRR